MKTVMVFGTFDGLHDGHRSLFKQARKHGDHVIAVVARDDMVEQLKGRHPRRSMQERMDELTAEGLADRVVPGDPEFSSYNVVKWHHPEVVALGYDQKALAEDLKEHLADFDWGLQIVVLEPHEPARYHSSVL